MGILLFLRGLCIPGPCPCPNPPRVRVIRVHWDVPGAQLCWIDLPAPWRARHNCDTGHSTGRAMRSALPARGRPPLARTAGSQPSSPPPTRPRRWRDAGPPGRQCVTAAQKAGDEGRYQGGGRIQGQRQGQGQGQRQGQGQGQRQNQGQGQRQKSGTGTAAEISGSDRKSNRKSTIPNTPHSLGNARRTSSTLTGRLEARPHNVRPTCCASETEADQDPRESPPHRGARCGIVPAP